MSSLELSAQRVHTLGLLFVCYTAHSMSFRWPALNRSFLHATAVLIGTMVGVGIFGIPFVFAKAGFGLGIFFLLGIGLLTIVTNLTFAEVILRTEGKHQLVGYTNAYLGPNFKKIVLTTNILGIYGAFLAYITVAGDFLNTIFSQFFYLQPFQYSLIFFVVISLILLFKFRTVAWIEFFLTALFVFIVLMIFAVGISKVELSNLWTFVPEYSFLPYGVLLFAFAGLTSLPIQREILRGQERQLKNSILFAVLLVGFLYALFAFTVVGISGDITSPDALTGLFDFLGYKVILLGSLFGVLSISTSSLMLGTALKDVFRLDYNMKPLSAWLLVILPPFLLFLGGFRTFIDIISLVGAVAIGVESIILLAVYWKARKEGTRNPEYTINVPQWVLYLLSLVFLLGVVHALFVA